MNAWRHFYYLDEVGQAQIDAARLLWDLRVADGNVRHDGQHQRLQRLVETVGEALGAGHLQRHRNKLMMIDWGWAESIAKIKMSWIQEQNDDNWPDKLGV